MKSSTAETPIQRGACSAAKLQTAFGHCEVTKLQNMKIDGACHCGQLTYEAVIDLERTGVCHCEDCQTFSGSAFRGFAPALEGTFKLLSGDPKRYVKTAASGHKNAMVFCPNCGTHICSTGADPESTFYGVRWGTARQRNEIRPKLQIFCRSAHKWVWDLGELPKHDAG